MPLRECFRYPPGGLIATKKAKNSVYGADILKEDELLFPHRAKADIMDNPARNIAGFLGR